MMIDDDDGAVDDNGYGDATAGDDDDPDDNCECGQGEKDEQLNSLPNPGTASIWSFFSISLFYLLTTSNFPTLTLDILFCVEHFHFTCV